MPTFRDDHILLISPGSRRTLAQLGLPESYTPAKHVFPSRVFPALEEGKWTFTKFRPLREDELELVKQSDLKKGKEESKKPQQTETKTETQPKDDDVEMGEAAEAEGEKKVKFEAKEKGKSPEKAAKDEDIEMGDAQGGEEGEEGEDEGEEEGEEDVSGDEGDEGEGEGEDVVEIMSEEEEDASEEVFVIDEEDQSDAVWPIKKGRVVNWSAFFALLQHIHEFINPPFHTPLLLVCPPSWSKHDRELVAQFAFERLKVPGFCLLDSATAIASAYGVQHTTVIDVGFEKTEITPVYDFIPKELAHITVPWGGEHMTQHLCKLLPHLSYEEVEALKCSHITEILLSGIEIPGAENAPRKFNQMSVNKDDTEEEGVTNIAAIVASGKTQEYLEKRQKEKQEAAKGGDRQKHLPNAERERNSFYFVEKIKDYIEDAEDEPELAPPQPEAGSATVEVANQAVNVEASVPAASTNGVSLENDATAAVAADTSAQKSEENTAPIVTTIAEAADAPQVAEERVLSPPKEQTEEPKAGTSETVNHENGTSEPTPAPVPNSDGDAVMTDAAPVEGPVSTEAPVPAEGTASAEGIADGTASAEGIASAEGTAPVEVTASVEETAPVEGAASVEGTDPVERASSVEGTTSAGNAVPANDAVPTNGSAPTDGSAPAITHSLEESEETRARLANETRQKERDERARRREEKMRRGLAPDETRREIEVGRERFQAAECGILSEIADAVYLSISSVDEVEARPHLWDNMIICGNGSRIRGFKEALLEILSQRYLISPSSATILTSEFPSTANSPAPTGTSTPLNAGAGPSGVNPLLVAATTANLPFGMSQPPYGGSHATHAHTASQSPTSMRLAKFPEYFPEWKDKPLEECVFLGAQVHAKVVFIVDPTTGVGNKGFLSRVEYNELGPMGIHNLA